MTPQRKRLENKTRMLERRCKVIDLHRQGYTQTEIAKMLKTTQATISGDLKTLLQEWRVQSNDAFEQYLDREMDNLIHVEQTAWKHFEKVALKISKPQTQKVKTYVEYAQAQETLDF